MDFRIGALLVLAKAKGAVAMFKATAAQLNGWQRIWVVSSAVSLIATLFIAVKLWPEPPDYSWVILFGYWIFFNADSISGARLELAAMLAGLWVAFIAATYLCGWAVGWIARGFSRAQDE